MKYPTYNYMPVNYTHTKKTISPRSCQIILTILCHRFGVATPALLGYASAGK